MSHITDEMLTAYADGEASPEERQAVEAALAADPALRAELEAYQALKAEISQSFSRVAAEPLPQRLRVSLSRRQASVRAPARRWFTPAAMAASLALGVAAGPVLLRVAEAPGGPLMASGDLTDALQSAADGERLEDVTLIASFQDKDDRICRAFEVAAAQPATGLACRTTDAGWRLAALEPGAPPEAYLPVGEEEPRSTIDRLTDGMRPLSPEELEALLSANHDR